MCGSASAGMPTPVSSTWSSNSGPAAITRTTTRPPPGVNRIAVAPLFVAEVGEGRPEALVLEGHAGLHGPWVELLDGAVHEPRKIERLPVELHEAGAEARHLEDLVDEPEQPSGAQ